MATGVQEADVWAAADAVLQAGEQPTVERVRHHLGRGSPNTVGPHLKAWFRGLGERLSLGRGAQSGELPEAVSKAFVQLWETALATARDEWSASLTAERAELAKAKDALKIDHTALQQVRERLQAREADLQASAQAAYAQAAAAEARLQAAEEQLGESRRGHKALDAELSATRDQVAALQQTLQHAQTIHQDALAAAQSRHAAHERRWLSEIDEQRQVLKKAKDEYNAQRKSAARDQTRHAEALGSAQAQVKQLTDALTEANAETTRLRLQGEADRETAQTAQMALQQRQTDMQSRLDDLRAQLSVKDAQIAALSQQRVARQSTSRARKPKG